MAPLGKSTTGWAAALAFALCACGRGEPRLALPDVQTLEFRPGVFQYDVARGEAFDRRSFPGFGTTDLDAHPGLEMTPIDEDPDGDGSTWNDDPDDKLRVRLTLDPDVPSLPPAGVIVIVGEQVTGPLVKQVSEEWVLDGRRTFISSTFFDRVTSVSTSGLGASSTLHVEWWDGHEQEMDVRTSVLGVTEEECGEYLVRFNGQEVATDWDPTPGVCRAGLLAGARLKGGQPFHKVYHRGLYLGVVQEQFESDAFRWFDPVNGFQASPLDRTAWLASLPLGSKLFDVTPADEPRIRPVVIELVRRADGAILDAAKILFTLAETPVGDPWLVASDPEDVNPGAVAQLSSRGLGRLEPTHADTLPYPIAPAGTQPRLSGRAIALPSLATEAVDVNLGDLPPESLAYFTEHRQPKGGPEFAGYLAYEAALAEAKRIHRRTVAALAACASLPGGGGACQDWVRRLSCVDTPPKPKDFRLHLDGVETSFDPDRPLDALVVGDIDRMELAFAAGTVEATFLLRDILGWLEGTIEPAHIRVEWDRPVGDLCIFAPGARSLSEFLVGSEDRLGWLSCQELSFASSSASLLSPIVFDLEAAGEQLATSYRTKSLSVVLAAPDVGLGEGTCSESWLADAVSTALFSWGGSIASVIGQELVASPGEDEALDRLLSPFELGIERVDRPPSGTPPYEIHPLEPYALYAEIGRTPADPDHLSATAAHGLHVPFLTRSDPLGGSPYRAWFCPVQPGQACNGLPGVHPDKLLDGNDPDGDPFDVALRLTTAHLSQALWAQASRPDRLGSESDPARLSIPDLAVPALAAQLGHADVVEALAAQGSAFGVRYHEAGAPFALVNDGPLNGLVYVVPNVVVELVAKDGVEEETVVARFIVDVVDDHLQVKLGAGGATKLQVGWQGLAAYYATTRFLDDCPGSTSGVSCADRLAEVVGSLWWPAVEGTLLDLVATTPAPQLFDAGQESSRPRQLENARTFLGDAGLTLVADLCNPARASCE